MIDSAAGESIAAPEALAGARGEEDRGAGRERRGQRGDGEHARPARKTRRRPSRSAARPPSSSRLPKTSE